MDTILAIKLREICFEELIKEFDAVEDDIKFLVSKEAFEGQINEMEQPETSSHELLSKTNIMLTSNHQSNHRNKTQSSVDVDL